MTNPIEFVQAPTDDRHFVAVGAELVEAQPLDGFDTVPAARTWAEHDGQLAKDAYRVLCLPGAAGYIAALIREDDEDTARSSWGHHAVDTYFEEVEGLDVFAARVDIDEFTRRLELIGDEITSLAHSVGFPDPGAAKAEDLLKEMWAKVHTHDARVGVQINETRALGLAA